MNYRFVGTHADEVSVGDTRIMCEPGKFVELSKDDIKANQSLIDDGLLMNVENAKPAKPGKEE